MRILVDEDLPAGVVPLLNALGHHAEHVRDAGLGGKPDQQVVAEERKRKAVLFTADIGIGSVLAYPRGSHSGIVVFRFPDHFRRDAILALVERFVKSADLASFDGALVVADSGGYRVRRSR